MKSNEYNTEQVQKKLEDLDNEVNTFIQVVKEVKEMKNSAEILSEKLVINEGELEQQKKELGQLISTTKNLGINIEEQTKGVIFDLEMKTDALIREVKSGISQISNICAKGSAQVSDQNNDLEAMKRGYETLKTMVDALEKKLNSLVNGHTAAPDIYDKLESSVNELKRSLHEIQKRPYEIDYKLTKMEERLELSINEKHSRQKNIMMVVLVILIATIFLSVINFYLS